MYIYISSSYIFFHCLTTMTRGIRNTDWIVMEVVSILFSYIT